MVALASCQLLLRMARIFNAINSVASAYGGFGKLSAVVTDGAPAMQGRHTGFTGRRVNRHILHCIIHQVSNIHLGILFDMAGQI